MIARSIAPVLLKTSQEFPVIFLTGPRQSGKTTLVQSVFPNYRYLNLEDPDLRQWAVDQPRDFLNENPWPVIIDKAQYAPKLFSYIQTIVDQKTETGMFILLGSQNFLLMEQISQSLAGRSAVLSLLPFSITELGAAATKLQTNELILKGFYPRVYQSVSQIDLFYKSYINTYVERDVRSLANIGRLNDYIRFIKLCAGRCGQLLNMASLATEAGIAIGTCKLWLSYLTTSYIIQLIQPYHHNYNKRLVKTPKIFFLDTGLLCNLLGIKSKDQLALHALRGSIFENLVYSELLKKRFHLGQSADIWFWRDNHGIEIDFIIEDDPLAAIEVKSGQTLHPEHFRNLKLFEKYNPSPINKVIIYDGPINRTQDGISTLNWRSYFK